MFPPISLTLEIVIKILLSYKTDCREFPLSKKNELNQKDRRGSRPGYPVRNAKKQSATHQARIRSRERGNHGMINSRSTVQAIYRASIPGFHHIR